MWSLLALVLTVGTDSALPAPAGAPSDAPATPVASRPVAAATRHRTTQPPPRVLILGDSIAAQMGHHSTVALREAGVDARVAAVWGIGLFTRDQYDMGAVQPDPPPTSLLGLASRAVAEFDPDVVAVYSNHNFWPPHPRDAAGNQIGYRSPAFQEMVRSLLTDLVRRLTVGGARVYLVAPVPLFPPDDKPENTAVWDAYMAVREELGVGVIEPGTLLAQPSGERFESLPDCAGQPQRVRPEGDVHLTYFGAGLMGGRAAQELIDLLPEPPATGPATRPTAPAERPVALVPAASGYRLVTCDGATFHFGRHSGALGSAALGQGRADGDPVVAATLTSDGAAALLLTGAGRVLRLDEARGTGDPVPAPEAGTGVTVAAGRRPVGIASAPRGGHWIATSDGRVAARDGAPELGDLLGQDEEVVALAAAPGSEAGYYLLTASGRIAGFGAAPSFGDLRGRPPGGAVVALAVRPDGDGYWVLDQAGNVHGFGAAEGLGSAAPAQGVWRQTWDDHRAGRPAVPLPPEQVSPTEAVALLPTPTGRGYWVALANGAVCHFGDAPTLGGVHRAEVDPLMIFVGQEYYAEGACTGAPNDRMIALQLMYDDIRQRLPQR